MGADHVLVLSSMLRHKYAGHQSLWHSFTMLHTARRQFFFFLYITFFGLASFPLCFTGNYFALSAADCHREHHGSTSLLLAVSKYLVRSIHFRSYSTTIRFSHSFY